MSKLQIFNTDVIPVYATEEGNKVVKGKELHKQLKISTPYRIWFPRQCEYGFEENVDFEVLNKNVRNSKGGRPTLDHVLSLDMAKHIAMIQRTPLGFAIRQKLIELEKQNDNSFELPSTLSDALRLAADLAEEKEKLQIENEEMKPKVFLADAIEDSNDTILVGELAKVLKQSGFNIGQNRLFALLRRDGYLIESGSRRNQPTQYSMERGWMRLAEQTFRDNLTGEQRVTFTTKITGKGQTYFVNRYCKQRQLSLH